MSGEYYILEEIVDHDSDSNIETLNANITNSSRSGKESKLHDIEKQLEIAESRCSCLKSQLDYMKQLYGVKKSDSSTTKCVTSSRISSLKKHYENKTHSEIKINYDISIGDSKINQTTQANLCEELGTNDQDIVMYNAMLTEMHDISNKPSKSIRSSVTKLPKRRKAPTSHSDDKKITVKIPKTTITGNLSSQVVSRASKRSVKMSRLRKHQSNAPKNKQPVSHKISDLSAHKLVEIYHNTAAKSSDSDDSNTAKKQRIKTAQESSRTVHNIPPLKINIKNQNDEIADQIDYQFCNLNMNMNVNKCKSDIAPPSKNCSIYSKNYTLPTIASRLKQVAKNYLNTYNFKAIPFCAAIATTPSHNIGINIQQVMNIIKTRQPIQGLSPTLTHNIVLAANKLNSTPLSTFISTIASKADYNTNGKQICPLSKSVFNYHQLEEMAKTVPDEMINEETEDVTDNEPVVTTTITGPSGEMQIRNQQRLLWSMETNDNMCTCMPQSGLELQQVVTKYQSNHTIYTNSQMSGTSTRRTFKRINNSSKNSRLGTGDRRNSAKMKTISEQIIPHHVEAPTPLQGKERNLKEVLTNLHNEFELLNNRYEECATKAAEKGNDEHEAKKEVTKLENELNKKEEEITMVMALYKEVLALKDQIKSLKRQASPPLVSGKDNVSKFQDYNNPKAAFHLTKLLRQIQHYQMHYKKTA